MSKRGMEHRRAWLIFCLCTAAVVASVPAALALGDVLPSGFRLEQVVTGTDRVSGLAAAPDGRIFFCEKNTGKLRVISNGILAATPVLTVAVPGTPGANEGLLDIAIHPDFNANHWLYVFYSDASKVNKIARYTEAGGIATSPLAILTLGTSVDGTRVGGSMAFGKDGKLYVAVGDLASSGNAQNAASTAGKILRINADGSVPADNPVAGSLVYSLGFRSGSGLGVNPVAGTLYETDQGNATTKEEMNAITAGNTTQTNFAWDIGAGKLSNPSYVDPLVEYAAVATPNGIVAYTGSRYPASFMNDVLYACQGSSTKATGKIEQVDVTGAKLDTFGSTVTFFDPARNGVSSPDVGCPRKWADMTTAPDGNLYLSVDTGTATGAANGIYRVIWTPGGAREVSAANTVPLAVAKVDATHVRLTFEDLRFDAFVGTPLASGQHNDWYTAWKGSLTTPFAYNHAVAATGNGTVQSLVARSLDVTVGAKTSEYFLVSSQNANFEGPLGFSTSGTAIPGYATTDYCSGVGYDHNTNGKCMDMEFKNKNGVVLSLYDDNGVAHRLSEYRDGRAIHLDLSANDCYWCQVQADDEDIIDDRYRARGTRSMIIFEKNLGGATPYATQSECATAIKAWRSTYGGTILMLCDVDTDGDGMGDVFKQLDRASCGGFPENYYIDHNWVIFDHECGYVANPGAGSPEANLGSKAWPSWCE